MQCCTILIFRNTTLKSESFDNASSIKPAIVIDCVKHYLLRQFSEDFGFQFVAVKFAFLDDTMILWFSICYFDTLFPICCCEVCWFGWYNEHAVKRARAPPLYKPAPESPLHCGTTALQCTAALHSYSYSSQESPLHPAHCTWTELRIECTEDTLRNSHSTKSRTHSTCTIHPVHNSQDAQCTWVVVLAAQFTLSVYQRGQSRAGEGHLQLWHLAAS